MPSQEYALLGGHDQALVNLINVENLYVFNGKRIIVRARGSYSGGQRVVRGDGLDFFRGYQSLIWLATGIYLAQIQYIRDNVLDGNWSGKVTVYTRLDDETTYVRANAIMRLPQPREADNVFTIYRNYQIGLSRIQVLA
jgi:hypothetical protein